MAQNLVFVQLLSTCVSVLYDLLYDCVSCVSGWLQSSDCVLPVLYNGQFLLAAGGRPLSSCTVGCLFLLREEVFLGLYSDWLGWERLPFYCTGCDPCRRGAIITLVFIFICLQEVQPFSSQLGALLKPTIMMWGKKIYQANAGQFKFVCIDLLHLVI